MHRQMVDADEHVAAARELMELVHQLYDSAEPDEWQAMRTPLGFLFNTISDNLNAASGDMEAARREWHRRRTLLEEIRQ